jgi:hypothetical protein
MTSNQLYERLQLRNWQAEQRARELPVVLGLRLTPELHFRVRRRVSEQLNWLMFQAVETHVWRHARRKL